MYLTSSHVFMHMEHTGMGKHVFRKFPKGAIAAEKKASIF